jgi:type III pantothenate kinase
VNQYKTPNTLGQDRLANAIAIQKATTENAAISVDVGTCLKFDFVDEHGNYLGGSISPGLHMRFKALQKYTANLPLIENWEEHPMIGMDTKSSIVSGVVEGMTNEINETLRRYQEKHERLTIFMTGGDYTHFENAINYRIFADPNLTLRGLKLILEANV